jgi:hypothetical protein
VNQKTEIIEAASNPEELENLYRTAAKTGREGEFTAAVAALYEEKPADPLIQAWHYRLQPSDDGTASRRSANWKLAVPFSILTGLLLWVLSDLENGLILEELPRLVIRLTPIAAIGALIFLALASRANLVRGAALGLALLGTAGYAVLLGPGLTPDWKAEQYLVLAIIHIPFLCWAAIGLFLLGRKSSVPDRIAFLLKSVEVMITAGLYLIFGMAFGGITIGMFAALGIVLPEIWLRLIAAGGCGLLPVLAVASVYDPNAAPSEQDFGQGLSRFIATMMRLLLPLTLAVLVIFIAVIPFNFIKPFENRDILVVFNLMLFGIMGLLLGATPIRSGELSPEVQQWLRRGVLAVAALAGLVSIYALSAVVYRTIDGGLTFNRLAVIGWNGINITILIAIVYNQIKRGAADWIAAVQAVFSKAIGAYLGWGLFLVFLLPLFF